jgi:hypothetical protein
LSHGEEKETSARLAASAPLRWRDSEPNEVDMQFSGEGPGVSNNESSWGENIFASAQLLTSSQLSAGSGMLTLMDKDLTVQKWRTDIQEVRRSIVRQNAAMVGGWGIEEEKTFV